jgi:mono/diheme cytochrome c family protein
MRKSLVALFLAPALIVGCGAEADQADVDAVKALTGNASAGQGLYVANCKVCHGEDAKSGSAKENLPSVADSESDEVIEKMLTGVEEMPSFKDTLSSQQMADVLAYLKSL